MLRITIEHDHIRVGKNFSLVLRRTLRVPDAATAGSGRGAFLPPNLGALPLCSVEEYRDRVPASWLTPGAAFVPLREREALWLDFQAASPHAVKVGAGGVNAISGRPWDDALEQPQNYLVCPPQEWLDGFRTGSGIVRQFVAVRLGRGYSVEGQLTGREDQGGIQLAIYGPKKGRALKPLPWMDSGEGLESLPASEHGMAAGGEIGQRIHPDPYGIAVWNQKSPARLWLHVVGIEMYREWTGLEPPYPPPSAEDYTAAGLPWYERLDEAYGDIAPPPSGSRLRSVAELDRLSELDADEVERPVSVKPSQLIKLRVRERKEPNHTMSNEGSSERKEKALRLVPDLKSLNETIRSTPVEELAVAADARVATEAAGGDEDDGAFESTRGSGRRARRAGESEELQRERGRVIEAGKRAVEKLSQDRGAALTLEEQTGFEAIVLLHGRPALLIQGGRFADPPDEWAILGRPNVRLGIEGIIQGVGRIEATNHPGGLDWIGTGFLVADDVVMTNRHVAVEFARTTNGKKWEFFPRMKVRIDYVEEFGAPQKAEFNVTEVIGIHNEVDMALLRVATRGSAGAKRPKPLPLAKSPKLKKGRQVYVVGYPASDSRRNDPVEMRRIFENIFDVKRLQPGKIMGIKSAGALLDHDCSTLGGNSGSCVVDLETHQVVGLHFRGKYLEGNTAVVLSKLTNDLLVKKAKLPFV